MASLIQLSEVIESGKIRISGEVTGAMGPQQPREGLPDFNHKNPAEWLHKRAGNTEYISLLRKCE